MARTATTFLTDIAVGLLAGLVATQVTNLAQGPLRRHAPQPTPGEERRVGTGDTSSAVAAGKVAEWLGLVLNGREIRRLGQAIHFGTGAAWGPVYGLLRRHAGLRPAGAGLATGAAMSLLLDSCVVPAFGLSAPNRCYSLATHIRGFAAHLVFGATTAAAAETAYRLTGGRLDPRGHRACWD